MLYFLNQDRALQLELTQGDTATLIKSANELLDWVESTLGQDFLHERPPGELDMLLHNSEELKVLYRVLYRVHVHVHYVMNPHLSSCVNYCVCVSLVPITKT